MQIKTPKSHSPTIHDNTEEDLIMVPPSVLENKLRDMEEYYKARGGIKSDIGLAVALLVAVLTASFIDIPYISGATIRGAFITALIFIVMKVLYDLYRIFWYDKRDRCHILKSLYANNKGDAIADK